MLSWGGRDVGFGDSCSDPARVCWWEGDQGDRAGFAYIAEGDPQGDPGAGRRVRLSAQGSAAAADRAVPGSARYVAVREQIGRAHVELQSIMRRSYAFFFLKTQTL